MPQNHELSGRAGGYCIDIYVIEFIMKKIFSFLLVGASALSIMACSGNADKKAATTDEAVTEKSDADPAVFNADAVPIGVVDLSDDTALRPDIKTNHVMAIDFNATWCGPCQRFKPAFEAAAEKYAGEVEFVSVDVDNNPETAKAFGVGGIPHIVILVPGKDPVNYVGTGDLLPQEKFFGILYSALAEPVKEM